MHACSPTCLFSVSTTLQTVQFPFFFFLDFWAFDLSIVAGLGLASTWLLSINRLLSISIASALAAFSADLGSVNAFSICWRVVCASAPKLIKVRADATIKYFFISLLCHEDDGNQEFVVREKCEIQVREFQDMCDQED